MSCPVSPDRVEKFGLRDLTPDVSDRSLYRSLRGTCKVNWRPLSSTGSLPAFGRVANLTASTDTDLSRARYGRCGFLIFWPFGFSPIKSWRNLALRSLILTACRMTRAVLRAVYGNLVLDINALSKRGTLLTVSKSPRKRMGFTGREKVSRKASIYSSSRRFSSLSLSVRSVRTCHFWNVFQAI
jgi:hypothetical protein